EDDVEREDLADDITDVESDYVAEDIVDVKNKDGEDDDVESGISCVKRGDERLEEEIGSLETRSNNVSDQEIDEINLMFAHIAYLLTSIMASLSSPHP
nr:hypothetical protein [Tanacetum cinerariifolium]